MSHKQQIFHLVHTHGMQLSNHPVIYKTTDSIMSGNFVPNLKLFHKVKSKTVL
jgi:hypothetical protein